MPSWQNSLAPNLFLLQDGHQGADGLAEPGSIPTLQHSTSADPGSNHPTSLDPLLADHAWIWITSHCCCTDSCSGNAIVFKVCLGRKQTLDLFTFFIYFISLYHLAEMVPKCSIGSIVNICLGLDFTSNIFSPTTGLIIMVFKSFHWSNRTECIRHLCRKTDVLSCHRCLKTLVLKNKQKLNMY